MSRLYHALGRSGPLIVINAGDHSVTDDEIVQIGIAHGSSDESAHSPSTASYTLARRLDMGSRVVQIVLDPDAATWIAARCHIDRASIIHRFNGRSGASTLQDKPRGTRLFSATAASWDSVLNYSPQTWSPPAGAHLGTAVQELLNPPWSIGSSILHSGGELPDSWHQAPDDPITPSDLLRILSQRLHLFSSQRNGALIIRTLASWITDAGSASTSIWPLSRSAVLSPTTWTQPADVPTQYRLTIRTPNGSTSTIITGSDGQPDPSVPTRDIDWSDFTSRSEHWRRIHGRRARTLQLRWQLPKLTVRLDQLIGSPRENHRRIAGMLLALNVGDPVPLAGDWPSQLQDVAYCSSLNERLTADGWSLDIGLLPYRWIDGTPDPITPRARTWNQATGTWNQATGTWNEGTTP